MSLSYRVSLKVCEVVAADDKTIHQLDLRDVLPEEEMKDLLRARLIEQGFEQSEDDENKLVREGKTGETVSVDMETLELTAELEMEQEVSGTVDTWGDSHTRAAAKRQAEARAQQQADAMLERGQQKAQSEVSSRLAAGESDRLEEMNQVLQDVYSEALKRKARRLGDVIEEYEGTNEAGEYELVIKIEV